MNAYVTALRHEEPDRVPADFLATPHVWDALIAHLGLAAGPPLEGEFVELRGRRFEIDLRVLSYDMFCRPPGSVVGGDVVDWWASLDRSTPNRMWRRASPDGTTKDIWGARRRTVSHLFGAYDEFAGWPLQEAENVGELKRHPWPEPSWWDFAPLPDVIKRLDDAGECHLRFRIGSVFETAWQLRGMQEFLVDLALNPEIPPHHRGLR